MNKQTLHTTRVTFYYDKIIKRPDGNQKIFDSCDYDCNLPDSKLEIFIKNKIENLKLFNCEVFQVAVYDVTSVLTKRIDYEKVGDDILEI